jgi:hypothetical protein
LSQALDLLNAEELLCARLDGDQMGSWRLSRQKCTLVFSKVVLQTLPSNTTLEQKLMQSSILILNCLVNLLLHVVVGVLSLGSRVLLLLLLLLHLGE